MDTVQRKCRDRRRLFSTVQFRSSSSIEIRTTHALPITNNVFYNTYKSALVYGGLNTIIRNNLIANILWSGTGQREEVRLMNSNFDAAIKSGDAVSVIMQVDDRFSHPSFSTYCHR